MFAAVLTVLLSCSGEEIAVAETPAPAMAPCRRDLLERVRYHCWLSSHPYSQAFYAQNGYNFRREFNIPWAVRSSYSLPVGTAASTRWFGAGVDPRANWPQPQPVPPPAPRERSKPTGPGATSSK